MRGSDGVAETPKPGDARLLNSKALVIGNNRLAAQEALRNLEHAGYMGRVHTLSLVGDVEEAAMQVVEITRSELAAINAYANGAAHPPHQRRCVILAGETTVKVAVGQGSVGGKGGRCTHMALRVAQLLARVPHWCARLATPLAGPINSSHTL